MGTPDLEGATKIERVSANFLSNLESTLVFDAFLTTTVSTFLVVVVVVVVVVPSSSTFSSVRVVMPASSSFFCLYSSRSCLINSSSVVGI